MKPNQALKPNHRLDLEVRMQMDQQFGSDGEHQHDQEAAPQALDGCGLVEPSQSRLFQGFAP
jgi:hypothetical protein